MADETWRVVDDGDLFYAIKRGHLFVAEGLSKRDADQIVSDHNQAADLTRQLAEERAARLALENEVIVLRSAFSHLIWDHKCGGYQPSKIALRGAAVRDGGE